MIDFEKEFSNKILDRGYDYYQNGQVCDVVKENNIISATVIGTENYGVFVEIDDNELVNAECSCPYAEDGSYCKHMAALLYYITEGKAVTKQNKKEIISNVLKNISKSKLEEFLENILLTNEKVYDKFRLTFNKMMPNLSIEEYRNKINRAINESAGRDGFIDYRESRDYEHAMTQIIEEADKLSDNGNYVLAFNICKSILDTIPNTPIDDSNGSTGSVSSFCIEVIHNVLDYSEDEYKLLKEILDYVLEELETDYLSNYGIELYPILYYYVSNQKYLELIENTLVNILDIKKTKQYFWNRTNYIDILIDIYNIKEKKDKTLNLLLEHSYDRNVCLKLVDEYVKNNRINEAINLLKQKLDDIKDSRLAEKLGDIYKEQNMQLEYKEILYKLFFELNKYRIDGYKKIKNLYSTEEWSKERENILNKIRKEKHVSHILIDIYIEEKMYDELFEIVKNLDMYSITKYEEYLLPKYNDKLVDIYISYCRMDARKSSNRSHYRNLARNLKHIKNMKNSKQKLDELMEELRNNYRNRSAMQEEIKYI